MDKTHYRPIIFHLFKAGKKPKQIHDELIETYGEQAPCAATVRYWVRKFKCGQETTEDAPRSGRLVSAIDQRLIDQIENLIKVNRKMSIRDIAHDTKSSFGTVFTVIHEYLNLEKKFAKWVPYKLDDAQKAKRVQVCRKFLRDFSSQFSEVKTHFFTSDETWIQYSTPDSANSSREWCAPDEPAPERARLLHRGESVMATVWWDAKGVVMLDFWKKSDQIAMNSAYYCEQLKELRKELPKVRRGCIQKRPLIWVDNAPIHNSAETSACFEQCGFERIKMPAYSPDLAPCDYFLFRNLKTWLAGRKFASREDLEEQVSAWFASKPADFYEKAIDQLLERMKRVVAQGGDYLTD